MEDGFKRYRDGVADKPPNAIAILDGTIEQLLAAITYIENTIDGAEGILDPLRNLCRSLMDHHAGHHPDLFKPIDADRGRGRVLGLLVEETTKRTWVLTLLALNRLAHRKNPVAETASAFRLSSSKVKNWSNRMDDPTLAKLVNDRALFWLGRHLGDPSAAAEEMKGAVKNFPWNSRRFT